MQHAYFSLRPLLAALFFLGAGGADAQMAWRPFRPGLIYSYEVPGATVNGQFTTPGVYSLRLDSAYVTATGDSAWAFNRVMRDVSGLTPGNSTARRFRKSRNNLFGQRLRWRPGSAEYTLESVTEGSAQTGVVLTLRPRVPVASTWVANTALGIGATLTSRGVQLVGGQPDTVAFITLSSGPVVRLSRRFGLLEGPQWLALNGGPVQWVATQLPVPLAQSPYSPLRLFDMQVGDEIGYNDDGSIVMAVPCTLTKTLCRIVARHQTNDSLVYTYRYQTRFENLGAPGCNPAGVTYAPVRTGRWAFSLNTGQSREFSELVMLSGEYRTSSASLVMMGRGVVQLRPGGGGCGGNELLAYEQLFGFGFGNGNGVFGPIPDVVPFVFYSVPLGMGPVSNRNSYMGYYRRIRNGVTTTCGSPSTYASLLPTRAAQAAAVASLFPNPAAEAATLTLAAPARSGAVLRLTDALGRLVWSAPVPAGQSAAAVPLAGRPAGVYLLQVQRPEAASVTLRLVKE